jgi:hypothetical protein
MIAHPVDQPPGECPCRHALGAGKVDELPVEAMAGGQPLALVEHLERVARELPGGLEAITRTLVSCS